MAGSEFGQGPDRLRDPLEKHPLEAIAMTGVMSRHGDDYAVLLVDQRIFYAKVGDYIGQNFGVITDISPRSVTVRETVRDAAGHWSDRETTLSRQADPR